MAAHVCVDGLRGGSGHPQRVPSVGADGSVAGRSPQLSFRAIKKPNLALVQSAANRLDMCEHTSSERTTQQTLSSSVQTDSQTPNAHLPVQYRLVQDHHRRCIAGLDTAGGTHLSSASPQISQWSRCPMSPKYDIFKKTNNSVVWVEAVEDIVAAKKRLISLSSTTPGEYKLWDSSRQEFINPMDECA